MDVRIIDGYKLWKTNYIGYDMANHSYKYSDLYTPDDVAQFTDYVEHQLDKVEKQMRSDPAFAETVKQITTNINTNPG